MTSGRVAWAFVASVGAHVLLVAALVAPWPFGNGAVVPQPAPQGTVEVVLVHQAATPPAAVPQAEANTAPVPAAAPAPRPVPDPAPASTPDPMAKVVPPPAPAAARMAVNLGGDPADAWDARSDTLKPPAPDARFRNLPPRYPPEAHARGEQGTVDVVVHVGTDGTAAGADVVQSSGFPSLDREARRAVLLWHFDPATQDGRPVPFDFPISLHFLR